MLDSVSVGTKGSVQLIRYDPRLQEEDIRRGENRGKCLPHRNVVRDVNVLGSWYGGSATFDLQGVLVDGKNHGLESVVLVSAGYGGNVIGAAKVRQNLLFT